jgi:malonyl-CoA/methylmalonyl-CoA synthetase
VTASPSLPARLRSRWDAAAPALVLLDEHGSVADRWSYATLDQRIDQAAGAVLTLGLGPGDVLALQAPRGPDWLALLLGAWSQGVAVLLLNPAYPPQELRFFLEDAGAVAAVLPEATRRALGAASLPGPAAEELAAWIDDNSPAQANPDISDEALAVLAYTSGTTGRPKGARIRHRDVLGTVEALHGAWGWSRDDTLVHTLPLFHIHGLFVAALGALWAGARTVLLPRFDARLALQAVADHQGTVLMGVPTHHHRFLALPPGDLPDTSSLRLVTSGSAPLPAARHTAFRERFGVEIVERYGMTEVGIVLSNPLEGERRPGTVGLPLPGVHSRVVDGDDNDVEPGQTGELWIHSPGLFAGYHGLPSATERAFVHWQGRRWLRTGDLCRQDPDGYHRIVGRATDMVITGGLNVYPREVEAVLAEVAGPALAAVAVVGVPDEEWGERLVGVVELTPGADARLSDWLGACRERLATYKVPKELRMVGALPRNAMGKVQKHHIRSAWATGSARFDDGAAWLEITTNPGLEDLVARDLQRQLQAHGLPAATVEREPKGARGRLLVRVPAETSSVVAAAEGLRSAHHLLRPLGRWQLAETDPLDRLHEQFAAVHISELDWQGEGPGPSFRVTCERSGVHPFTSEDVARTVGAAVRVHHPRPVDLKGYDVHVRADVRGDRCHGGIQLTARSLTTRYDRPYRPQIKLRPNVAWAMAELARNPEHGPAHVVLDPFCGSGTLLAEAGRRWPGARLCGSDIRTACVEGTRENGEHLGLSTLTCREGDARAVDELWPALRPDTVLANLPFGLRLGRSTNHYWLYRKFLEGLSRITEPGARVVLLVGKKKLLNRVLLPGWVFKALHVRIVEMGGTWPALFLLERRDVPPIPRAVAPPANPASRD